jgi:predicted ATPase
MMLLTGVIGAKDGSVVMIDEIEDSLHPAAIRAVLDLIRRRAAEHDLTVLMTTHSPVVIDLFDDTPEQVYVMEEGRAELPVAVTSLHDRDWLAHFLDVPSVEVLLAGRDAFTRPGGGWRGARPPAPDRPA